MLQVLLHTTLQTLREPDGTVSADTLLSECQSSTFDPCQILFEFLGKTIVQPRRDLFEKARGLSVSHSTSSGFLTEAESESAMATARQHNYKAARSDRHSHRCGTTQHFWRPWPRQWQEQPLWCEERCRPWRQLASAAPTDSALSSSVGPSVDLFGTAAAAAAAATSTTTTAAAAVGWWAGCTLGDRGSLAEYPSRPWLWSW